MSLDKILKSIARSKSEIASHLPLLSLNQPGVEHRIQARIATDLVPMADGDVRKGTKIYVTGYDGPNLDGQQYRPSTQDGEGDNPWLKALRKWLNRGADVTYFLLQPSTAALKHLRELSLEQHKGRLLVYSRKKTASLSAELRDTLKEWRFTHFAVFENPPQFWLESYHKPNTTEARNCYFFPTKVAKKSELPSRYLNEFQVVVKACGEPIFRKKPPVKGG